MIRGRDEKSDVIIKWPSNARRINAILRSGRCPSYCRPLKARERAIVLLADPGGNVMLRFRLHRVESPVAVTGADGKRYERGCILVAEPGSTRRPKASERDQYPAIPQPAGALRYFDAKSAETVWYGGRGSGSGPSWVPRPLRVRLRPYRRNNEGQALGRPEAELVARYVDWLGGSEERFGQCHLQRVGLFADLVIRGINLLVEAKVHTDRETIRQAIGQLYDYRTYFERRPRLAVLVPARPSTAVLNLLPKLRIHCIWETASGRFNDSLGGDYTRDLRRPAAG